jgi:hypothetical protein
MVTVGVVAASAVADKVATQTTLRMLESFICIGDSMLGDFKPVAPRKLRL